MVKLTVKNYFNIFLFQTELDETVKVWNSHIIRPTRRGLPSGRPNIMFEVPYLYGANSYLTSITQQEHDSIKDLCTLRSDIPCDIDIYELCCHLLHVNNFAYPRTVQEATNLYLNLRRQIRALLNI